LAVAVQVLLLVELEIKVQMVLIPHFYPFHQLVVEQEQYTKFKAQTLVVQEAVDFMVVQAVLELLIKVVLEVLAHRLDLETSRVVEAVAWMVS
jgi:hypothetical protein